MMKSANREFLVPSYIHLGLAVPRLLLAAHALALLALPAFAQQGANERWAARRARLSQRPKKIFAHCMGCFPIGRGGISPGYARSKLKQLRHDSANFEHAFGGRVRGEPCWRTG